MSVQSFTFDPEGDLLLRLRYPSANEIQAGPSAPAPNPVDLSGLTLHGANTPEASSAEITRSAHMLVSSKHLILASPVFKAMFRSGFRESFLLSSSETVIEIDLPEDDPEPFEIFMNIVHGHVRKVPPQLSLRMLADLSVIVDKYQALEITDLYVNMWMPKLRETLANGNELDILLWLSISWVFKLKDDFTNVSKIAQLGSVKYLDDWDVNLPIPSLVLDNIESVRQGVIASVIALIDGLIKQYNSGTTQCNTVFPPGVALQGNMACDVMVLGSLIRILTHIGLWPLPKFPYEGLSILSLVAKVRIINIMALCDENRLYNGLFVGQASGHGWNQWIQDKATTAYDGVKGLGLLTVSSSGQPVGTSSNTSA